MSRPKDLPTALQTWGNGNYGAGANPWNGTPQRVAPAQAYVPGVSRPAEHANYLHGNAFDAAQAVLNMVGQLPALNTKALAAIGATATNIGWNPADQSWWAISGASGLYASFDGGASWHSSYTLSGTPVISDIAFDTAGNYVVVGETFVQEAARTSFNTYPGATAHAGVLTGSGIAPQLVYESVSGRFVTLGASVGAASYVHSSPNRSGWAGATLPAAWATHADNGFPYLGAGGGLVVAAKYNSSSSFRTMRSADGGITWTNDQVINVNGGISITDNAVALTRPTWSATDGLWYIAVNNNSTAKVQIFSSPAAITWTSAATLLTNDCIFYGLVAIGSLLVGMHPDGRVFASWNKGVSWYRCGALIALTSPTILKAGEGAFMALGTSGTYAQASHRYGLPSVAA